MLHKNSAGTVLDGAAYTYDSAGNRLQRTDKRTGTVLKYTYDNIYQLLTAKQGATTKESYTYDLVGNRLSSLGVSPYTYNSSNELMTLPSGSYTYDKNGNTLTKPDGTQYTWDLNNELTQVVLPGSGGTVNFKYDPFGRRIQKAFTQGTTTTTTNYLYDGSDVLEELDAAGNVTARYNRGPWFDEPLSILQSGIVSYYEADGLGSISSVSGSGSLTDTYTYDSYGKTMTLTGTTVNPYRYTGRELDAETGLYYYRARYYDTTTGRFLNEDPVRFAAGINFYDYVSNAPTGWVDGTGLSQDQYVPDTAKHGDPHVDRYRDGRNIGRYKPDGTPIPHKGKLPPPIPNRDKERFKDAADKCTPPNPKRTNDDVWWDTFWSEFWYGVHNDQDTIEDTLRNLLNQPRSPVGGGPPILPDNLLVFP